MDPNDEFLNEIPAEDRASTQVQTIIFDKARWTIAKAKQWLKDHSFRSDKVDETENTFRFRQFDPSECQGGFMTLTKNMPRGMRMVACRRRQKREDKMTKEGMVYVKFDAKDFEQGMMEGIRQSIAAQGVEHRIVPGKLQISFRDDKPTKITGYAAVFNQPSRQLWGFREKIRKGAFKRSLEEKADVRGLINHDPNLVLGRIASKTLSLNEDDHGLRFENDPPDTSFARDLTESIKRGDVDQCSFAFRTRTDEWHTEDGIMMRELIDVDLIDVSVVTFPAYPQTQAQVRGLDLDSLAGVLLKAEHGVALETRDISLLESAIETLRENLLCEAIEPDLELARQHLEKIGRALRLAELEGL